MITKKPTPKTADDFIAGAKAEQQTDQTGEDLLGQKDKTFLLRMPYRLWEAAKKKAGGEGISLHDFILRAVKNEVMK